MKVKVKQDACIGCGACEAIAPNYFKLNDEGLSSTIKKEVNEEDKENVQDAIDSCPTGAIEEDND